MAPTPSAWPPSDGWPSLAGQHTSRVACCVMAKDLYCFIVVLIFCFGASSALCDSKNLAAPCPNPATRVLGSTHLPPSSTHLPPSSTHLPPSSTHLPPSSTHAHSATDMLVFHTDETTPASSQDDPLTTGQLTSIVVPFCSLLAVAVLLVVVYRLCRRYQCCYSQQCLLTCSQACDACVSTPYLYQVPPHQQAGDGAKGKVIGHQSLTLQGQAVQGVVVQGQPAQHPDRRRHAGDRNIHAGDRNIHAGARNIHATSPGKLARAVKRSSDKQDSLQIATHPTSNVVTHPTSNVVTHPTSNVVTHPTSNFVTHPTTHPTSNVVTHPTTHPTSNVVTHPTTHPTSNVTHPITHPTSNVTHPSTNAVTDPKNAVTHPVLKLTSTKKAEDV